jgi:hypothetical protein
LTPIGGYFGLELRNGGEFHTDSTGLNSGRNALEYILKAARPSKIYVPFYTCPVVMEPIAKLGIEHEFYRIDERMFPEEKATNVRQDELLLYTNYFGINESNVDALASLKSVLVVDNAQAFFSLPRNGVHSFNSCRKFFGVPDGSYLNTPLRLDEELETDASAKRCAHLLLRTDEGAEAGYQEFQNNENRIAALPIKKMSQLTRSILQNIDYDEVIKRRRRNFSMLHASLGKVNEMTISMGDNDVPMVYPFLSEMPGLKKRLIDNKIFTATYWNPLPAAIGADSFEARLSSQLVSLPVDQRLDESDMQSIINIINNEYKR